MTNFTTFHEFHFISPHFTVITDKFISLNFISHPLLKNEQTFHFISFQFKGGDPTFQFISFHE
jgi:hypothetical protein